MRSQQRRATWSFPDLSRLCWPLPPLAPARAAAVPAAVVLEVAAPTAATAAHAPVSGALALMRGKCLQYFFYTGLLRASGALARLARHTLLICIGRRPCPPADRARRCCALSPIWPSQAVARAPGPLQYLRAYMCVYLYIYLTYVQPHRPRLFFFPNGDTQKSLKSPKWSTKLDRA